MSSIKHRFGSAETERKLDCLRQYLAAYSTAMKNRNFCRLYIDAFAGTGDRTETRAVLPFFGEGSHEISEITTPGSARIALETTPSFHHIVMIEQDPKKASALNKVLAEYPKAKAQVRQGDANEIVQRICRIRSWKAEGIRGVIFLDPYGMEVNWKTVEAIAETEALDCWYFFPLSGLYRNAALDPLALDGSKISSLNSVLGTESWRTEWYSESHSESDLFGESKINNNRIADVDTIEHWVHRRLSNVFRGKVLKPLRLYHPGGAPMASLFFAVSNPSKAAVSLAEGIASHILKAGISS